MSNASQFLSFRPRNNKLKRYIAYYYFHYNEDPDSNIEFTFYPNYQHALTAYCGSNINLDNKTSVVNPTGNQEITLPVYCINLDTNMHVNIKGKFNKIGIVFHPIGINHFIDCDLSEIMKTSIQSIDCFGEDFQNTLKEVFLLKDYPSKVARFDAFFEKRLNHFNILILDQSIQKIIETNGTVRVEELAEEFAISRKTLLRLFKKHICASVEEYKKMVMFRNTLNYAQNNRTSINLTDVALYNMYYDQAHFIKHFKAITRETPSSLLTKIEKIGSENTFWNFEK